ncbi:MAG TPA: tetraacyldisaccharide 4'-kinase [Planctomycetaceae bacterium]|nr:tetraacyldisaccharide 4'-kinase [Planctomycetaceae bacterium]
MATEFYRKLISGESRGVVPSCLRTGLHLLSCGYAFGTGIRNRLYASGLKTAFAPGVPTVAIGNITTGGTGKTPVVAWLTNWFSARGFSPAILSRGYRSLDSGENDEKLVLDRLCPGVPHLQNPDRVASARLAVARDSAQVLILDDAFQHRRIGRDLNLCLIDATNPWGYGYLLPRGLLREPRSELRRADLIIVTRCDQISQTAFEALVAEIQRWAKNVPIVQSRFAPNGWRTLDGRTLPLEEFQTQSSLAFCGLGNPPGFRQSLDASGCAIEEFVTFPDHHHYSSGDLETLTKAASDWNCSLLLTTLKDLVKLPAESFPGLTVAALEISFEILAGEAALTSQLDRLAAGIRRAAVQR